MRECPLFGESSSQGSVQARGLGSETDLYLLTVGTRFSVPDDPLSVSLCLTCHSSPVLLCNKYIRVNFEL